MEEPLLRPISQTNQHDPPDRDKLRKGKDPEFYTRKPAVFDTRYMMYRYANPDHPLLKDPDARRRGDAPRQQARGNTNIIELFSDLEYFFSGYQTLYTYLHESSSDLVLPFQFLEPKAGWVLEDRTNGKAYTVKAVPRSKDLAGASSWDHRVIIDGEGPPLHHDLVWKDPFGVLDNQQKIVKLMHYGDLRQLMDQRTAKGDNADVRKPWVPAVSYDLVTQQPGSTSGPPFGKQKELKPRYRHAFRDPDNPKHHQQISGWWMDTLVEFRPYAIGGQVAERMAVWLRHFLMRYTNALMELGVQQMFWWTTNRGSEEARTVYDLNYKTVQWYFRLEEVLVQTVGELREVDIKVQVLGADERDPSFTSEAAPDPFAADTSDTGYLNGTLEIGDEDNI